jgi:hypothetical protein
MAQWNEKYFITKLKETPIDAPWNPVFSEKEAMRLLAMDSEVRDGAFYMELAWFWPGKWPESKTEEGTVKTHSHEFDEAIAFVGTNPDDPYDLGGEVELWVDGEKNILDRSFVAFIPARTPHCPLSIRRVDRPIFHFTAGFGKKYY